MGRSVGVDGWRRSVVSFSRRLTVVRSAALRVLARWRPSVATARTQGAADLSQVHRGRDCTTREQATSCASSCRAPQQSRDRREPLGAPRTTEPSCPPILAPVGQAGANVTGANQTNATPRGLFAAPSPPARVPRWMSLSRQGRERRARRPQEGGPRHARRLQAWWDAQTERLEGRDRRPKWTPAGRKRSGANRARGACGGRWEGRFGQAGPSLAFLSLDNDCFPLF